MSKSDTSLLALQRQDIFLENNILFIHICWSKVDQRGKGVHIVLGRYSLNRICSILATVVYLTFRGQHPGYFFVHSDGSPLTKYQFWKLTNKVLQQSGIVGLCFSVHSFQIGAASTAVALGYGSEDIKRLGYWNSGCYRHYVHVLSSVQVCFWPCLFCCRLRGSRADTPDLEFRSQFYLLGSAPCCKIIVGKQFKPWGHSPTGVVEQEGYAVGCIPTSSASWSSQLSPNVLVVHLSGKDLAKHSGKSLVIDIIHDLHLLKTEHPSMSILWSTIIPRVKWQADCPPQSSNTAHRRVNREVCWAVEGGIGTVIGHRDISLIKLELYRYDGVHLSDQGLDLFLQGIQRGLHSVVNSWGGQETQSCQSLCRGWQCGRKLDQ